MHKYGPHWPISNETVSCCCSYCCTLGMDSQLTYTTTNTTLVQELDNVAGQKAQLSVLELAMLSASVFAAGSGPLLLGGHITQFLAPASAACE